MKGPLRVQVYGYNAYSDGTAWEDDNNYDVDSANGVEYDAQNQAVVH